MSPQSLRESVMDFMIANPTAWRPKALAAKLGVGVERVDVELLRLNAEGKLVSCTVSIPGRQPQTEYRIAANELKSAPKPFVISRKSSARARPRK